MGATIIELVAAAAAGGSAPSKNLGQEVAEATQFLKRSQIEITESGEVILLQGQVSSYGVKGNVVTAATKLYPDKEINSNAVRVVSPQRLFDNDRG